MQALFTDDPEERCKKMKVEDLKKHRDAPAETFIDKQDQRRNKKKKSVKPNRSAGTECEAAREVGVDLEGSDLWKRFDEIGTEMIITKAGRRMFPSLRVKVHNLDPHQQYSIAMDITPVDSKRYRYVYHSSQWMVAGNTDHSCLPPRLYVHPDSPSSGHSWMRQIISFDRVKLTNNEMDDKGHIVLKSMHKYRPRIHVIELSPVQTLVSLPEDGVCSFSFPETQFITVTAYQNQQITKLKIDRNPFAKGFRQRDGGVLGSYAWHSPFNLHFKSIAMELPAPAGLALSSSGPSFSPARPVSFSSPHCCRSLLTYTAHCSFCLAKLNTYAGLRPVLDLPLVTALQRGDSRSAQRHNREPVFVSPYSYGSPASRRFSTVTHHLQLAHTESLFT